jgi:hypothetical protein
MPTTTAPGVSNANAAAATTVVAHAANTIERRT